MLTERTALYRFFNAAGVLLYVGISKDPQARCWQYASKPWWREVARKTIDWHETRTLAGIAEPAAYHRRSALQQGPTRRRRLGTIQAVAPR